MSDHHGAPDPLDEAYAQAEAMLSDGAEREPRRARVLAAVARERQNHSTAPSPPVRQASWRQGGWLAAACVVGLSLVVASQVYHPAPRQLAAPRATPSLTGPPKISPALPARPAPTRGPARKALPAISGPALLQAEPRRLALIPQNLAAAPSPPPPPLLQAPSPPPSPYAGPPASVVAATASAGEDMAAVESQRRAMSTAKPAPLGAIAPAPPQSDARLRAAAAAGRAAEVDSLLAQGVFVDAPDADGETALMKAIKAGRPALAAVLRSHGASLERRNRAGESARDMALALGDPALDRALGLAP